MYYIIYQTAFIGDIILSASMIKTIIQIDSTAKIIFITTPAGEAILHNDKRIHKIITYDKKNSDKGISSLFGKINQVKKIIAGEDTVFISPHRFLRASLFGFLTRAGERIGFRKAAASFLYNIRVPYRFGIHETERNFELVSAFFGNRLKHIKPEKPEIFSSDNDIAKIKVKIFGSFLPEDKIIAIAPGSVWNTKRWPFEYYKELILNLTEKGFRIILIGGKEDRELCDRLAAGCVLNLSGELSITESAAAVSLCRAMVSNDSAPLHIASAMNIPTVAIFGATTPYLGFGPLADRSVILEDTELLCRPCGRHGGHICREDHFSCMKNIKPDMVMDAVIRITG